MALSQVDVNILTVLIVNVILFLVSIIVFFLIVKNRKSVIKRFLSYIRIPTSSQPERTVAPTSPHEGSPTYVISYSWIKCRIMRSLLLTPVCCELDHTCVCLAYQLSISKLLDP
jgi:hypothetical protein